MKSTRFEERLKIISERSRFCVILITESWRKFTLMQYSVSAILGLIEAGQFVIPEIQRPFVWKRGQVRDLIDSLYNGYPTGYIITWKNPDVEDYETFYRDSI